MSVTLLHLYIHLFVHLLVCICIFYIVQGGAIMPRVSRKRSSTGIYHVMLRGNNRQTIFENDDDKNRFISTISKCKNANNFSVFGYCLMDNHVHLLVKEGEDIISNIIKRISSDYVYWYNKKYERVGHLFQERFKSQCVQDNIYFLGVLRYIHQNPVKASIVSCIDKYNWSSYNAYINSIDTIDGIDIIDCRYVFTLFSDNITIAKSQFVKYMNDVNNEEKADYLDYNEFVKLTDNEVKLELSSMGINNISDLQKLERQKRDLILQNLKKTKGISIRQLSRLTGVSRNIIAKL